MTLTELLPAVQELSAADKLTLFHVLAEELNSEEDVSPLTPGKTYYLPPLCDAPGAAEVLMNELKKAGF